MNKVIVINFLVDFLRTRTEATKIASGKKIKVFILMLSIQLEAEKGNLENERSCDTFLNFLFHHSRGQYNRFNGSYDFTLLVVDCWMV